MADSKRVYELAKELGVTSKEVLAGLRSASEFVRSASSVLTPRQVDLASQALANHSATYERSASPSGPIDISVADVPTVPTSPPSEDSAANTAEERQHLANLITQAFESARSSGKEDWRLMEIPVLKNRINQIIGEKFDQRQYGYRRVVDFALDFPELLAVDETRNPPSAFLLENLTPVAFDENLKLRSDLWRAVLDYQSGETYYFVDGLARPASEVEQPGHAPVLPTITADDVAEWRRDFANSITDLISGREELGSRLNEWVSSGGGSNRLPGLLRGRWNSYMKQAVNARLESFFASIGSSTPPGIVVRSERTRREDVARHSSEESQIRQLIIDCVDRMTLEELRQVSLPITSYLRVRA